MLFRTDRRLLALLLGLTVAVGLFFSTAALWGPRRTLAACREAVKALAASGTAFAPSGSALRHPGDDRGRVDLRFSPRLQQRER